MKVGQLTDCYLPVINGVTTFVRLLKRTLEANGVDTYVFTTGQPRYPDAERNIVRSPGVPLGATGYYAAPRYTTRALALARSMDVLHVHHPIQAALIAARIRRRRGQPVIFTSHTRYDLYARYYLPFLPPAAATALMSAWIRRISAEFDLIVAVSPAARAMLRAMRVQAPVEVIPNGIELERFAQAEPAARPALGLPPGEFVCMYVGRLGPEKNLPVLLEAFALARLPRAVLVLVGDGPLAGELAEQTEELGLAGRVRFLGKRPNETVPGLVACADAFITASVSEGHPITVIEALAAGRPVVAFNAPGIRETVHDGENGLLAAPEDPAALAQTLARLAADAELRQRLSAGARASAQQYDIRLTTRRLLGRYEDLLKERRPAATP